MTRQTSLSCAGFVHTSYCPLGSAATIVSTAQPFRRLQSRKAMSSKAKVGTWLAKTDGDDDDDASSESGSSASSAEVNGTTAMSGSAAVKPFQDTSDEEDDGDAEVVAVEEIDWEVLLPKIRLAVMDPSAKRRRAFVTRYLKVSAEGSSAETISQFYRRES